MNTFHDWAEGLHLDDDQEHHRVNAAPTIRVKGEPTVPVVQPALGEALDGLHGWLEKFICPMHPRDLRLLTMWIAHTHYVGPVFRTTPRLIVTSPLPEAGKTTVLEHCERFCHESLQAASISSQAVLSRALQDGVRTFLIDEAEKTLRPDNPITPDLLAIINSGYKAGGVRLISASVGGQWEVSEQSTFSPAALAGISPNLPDDTLSRAITMRLLPDVAGEVEDSDWEFFDPDARALRDWMTPKLISSAEHIRNHDNPAMPEGVRGRMTEKWRPLKRLADVAGGDWPAVCVEFIEYELEVRQAEKESGMKSEPPSVEILRDMIKCWPGDLEFWPVKDVVDTLTEMSPARWGANERHPRGLTPQRLGSLLGKHWGIRAEDRIETEDGRRVRAYSLTQVRVNAARASMIPFDDILPGRSGRSGRSGLSEEGGVHSGQASPGPSTSREAREATAHTPATDGLSDLSGRSGLSGTGGLS